MSNHFGPAAVRRGAVFALLAGGGFFFGKSAASVKRAFEKPARRRWAAALVALAALAASGSAVVGGEPAAPPPLLSDGEWSDGEWSDAAGADDAASAGWDERLSNRRRGRERFESHLRRRMAAVGTNLFSNASLGALARGLEDGKLGEELSALRLRTADSVLRAAADSALAELRGGGDGFIKHLEIGYQTPLGGRAGSVSADALASLWEDPQNLFYAQFGGRLQDLDPGGNLGFGVRSLAFDQNLLIGANLFFDYLSDDQRGVFWRRSLGLEVKSAPLDFSANWYRRLTRPRILPAESLRVYSADGWDVELTGRIPSWRWLEFGLRHYVWERLNGGDLRGLNYRLSLSPLAALRYELEYDDPEEGGGDVGVHLRWASDFGGDGLLSAAMRKRGGGEPSSAESQALWSRRYERVRRVYEQRIIEELVELKFAELLSADPRYTPGGDGAALSVALSSPASAAVDARLAFVPPPVAGAVPPDDGYVILPAVACGGRGECQTAIAPGDSSAAWTLSAGGNFRDDIVVALLDAGEYAPRGGALTVVSTIPRPPRAGFDGRGERSVYEGGAVEVMLRWEDRMGEAAAAAIVFSGGDGDDIQPEDFALFAQIDADPELDRLACGGGECILPLPQDALQTMLQVRAAVDEEDEDQESLLLSLRAAAGEWTVDDEAADAEIVIVDPTALSFAEGEIAAIEGEAPRPVRLNARRLRRAVTVTIFLTDDSVAGDFALTDDAGREICDRAKSVCRVELAAAATGADLLVSAQEDGEAEVGETATLALRPPAAEGYRIGDPLRVALLDQQAIYFLAGASAVREGRRLTVTVGVTGGAALTVSLSASDADARLGADYRLLAADGAPIAVGGDRLFAIIVPAGDVTTFVIEALADALVESGEGLAIAAVAAPVGFSAAETLQAEIEDANVGAGFTARRVEVAEGEQVGFAVAFSAPAPGGAIRFRIDSSAAAAADYRLTDGDGHPMDCPGGVCAAAVAAGAASINLTVQAARDGEVESAEALNFILESDPVYIAAAGDDTLAAIIADTPLSLSFAPTALAIEEGAAAALEIVSDVALGADYRTPFIVERGGALGADEYAFDGAVCDDGDPRQCSALLAAGKRAVTVTIAIVADWPDDDGESMTLALGDAGGALAPGYARDAGRAEITARNRKAEVGFAAAAGQFGGADLAVTITLGAATPAGEESVVGFSRSHKDGYAIYAAGAPLACSTDGADACLLTVAAGADAAAMTLSALQGAAEAQIELTLHEQGNFIPAAGAEEYTAQLALDGISIDGDGGGGGGDDGGVQTLTEGESVDLRLSGYTGALTITLSGAAVYGEDYTVADAGGGPLDCGDGDCEVAVDAGGTFTVRLAAITDGAVEEVEELTVSVVAPAGYDGGAVGVAIRNAPIVLSFAPTALALGEGAAAIVTMRANVAPIAAFDAPFIVKDGGDLAAGEYDILGGGCDNQAPRRCFAAFPANQAAAELTISIYADWPAETSERLTLALGGAGGGIGAGYIADDAAAEAAITATNAAVGVGFIGRSDFFGVGQELAVTITAAIPAPAGEASVVRFSRSAAAGYRIESGGGALGCVGGGAAECSLTLAAGVGTMTLAAVAGANNGRIDLTLLDANNFTPDPDARLFSAQLVVGVIPIDSGGGGGAGGDGGRDVDGDAGPIVAEGASISLRLWGTYSGPLTLTLTRPATDGADYGANADYILTDDGGNPLNCAGGVCVADLPPQGLLLSIAANRDGLSERAERLTISVVAPAGFRGGGIGVSIADTPISLSFAPAAQTVGEGGEGAAVIRADIAPASSREIPFVIRGGLDGDEYELSGAACDGDNPRVCSIFLRSGATEASLTVSPLTDWFDDDGERMTLILNDPAAWLGGGLVANPTAARGAITVLNEPVAVGFAAAGGEFGGDGTLAATITISSPTPPGRDSLILFSRSALDGYGMSSGGADLGCVGAGRPDCFITIRAGANVEAITLIAGGGGASSREIDLRLKPALNFVPDSDNDLYRARLTLGEISIVAEGGGVRATVAEGDSVFLNLSGYAGALTVTLAQAASATFGDDYAVSADGNPLNCRDGACEVTVSNAGLLRLEVAALADGAVEDAEELTIAVVPPPGYAGGTMAVAIENAPIILSFAPTAVEIAEGAAAAITLAADIAPLVDARIPFIVKNGGDLRVDEYRVIGGGCDQAAPRRCEVAIPAGATAAAVTVSVLADWESDDGERLTLVLGGRDGALSEGYAAAEGEVEITVRNRPVFAGFAALRGDLGGVAGDLAVTISISQTTPARRQTAVKFIRSSAEGYEMLADGGAVVCAADGRVEKCVLPVAAGRSDAAMTLRALPDAPFGRVGFRIVADGNIAPTPRRAIYKAILARRPVLRFTENYTRMVLGGGGALPLSVSAPFGAPVLVTISMLSRHAGDERLTPLLFSAANAGDFTRAAADCSGSPCQVVLALDAAAHGGVPIVVSDAAAPPIPADVAFSLADGDSYELAASRRIVLRLNHDAWFAEDAAGVAEGASYRGTISFSPPLAKTDLTLNIRAAGGLSSADFQLFYIGADSSRTAAACAAGGGDGLLARCGITTPAQATGAVVFELDAAVDGETEAGEAVVLSLAQSRLYEADPARAEQRVLVLDAPAVSLKGESVRLAADDARRITVDWMIMAGTLPEDASVVLRRTAGDAVAGVDYRFWDSGAAAEVACQATGSENECALPLRLFSGGDLFVGGRPDGAGKSAVLALAASDRYAVAAGSGALMLTIAPFAAIARAASLTLAGFESAPITITTSAPTAAEIDLTLAADGDDNLSLHSGGDFAAAAYLCDGERRCTVPLAAGATSTVVHLRAAAHLTDPVTLYATVRLTDGEEYIAAEVGDNRAAVQLEDGVAVGFHSDAAGAITVGGLISIQVTTRAQADAADKQVAIRFEPTALAPPDDAWDFGIADFAVDLPATAGALPADGLISRMVPAPPDGSAAETFEFKYGETCDLSSSSGADLSYGCRFLAYPFASGESRLTLNLGAAGAWPASEITVAVRPTARASGYTIHPSAILATAVVFALDKPTVAFAATALESDIAGERRATLEIALSRAGRAAGALVDDELILDGRAPAALGGIAGYEIVGLEDRCFAPADGRRRCRIPLAAAADSLRVTVQALTYPDAPRREYDFAIAPGIHYEIGAASAATVVVPAQPRPPRFQSERSRIPAGAGAVGANDDSRHIIVPARGFAATLALRWSRARGADPAYPGEEPVFVYAKNSAGDDWTMDCDSPAATAGGVCLFSPPAGDADPDLRLRLDADGIAHGVPGGDAVVVELHPYYNQTIDGRAAVVATAYILPVVAFAPTALSVFDGVENIVSAADEIVLAENLNAAGDAPHLIPRFALSATPENDIAIALRVDGEAANEYGLHAPDACAAAAAPWTCADTFIADPATDKAAQDALPFYAPGDYVAEESQAFTIAIADGGFNYFADDRGAAATISGVIENIATARRVGFAPSPLISEPGNPQFGGVPAAGAPVTVSLVADGLLLPTPFALSPAEFGPWTDHWPPAQDGGRWQAEEATRCPDGESPCAAFHPATGAHHAELRFFGRIGQRFSVSFAALPEGLEVGAAAALTVEIAQSAVFPRDSNDRSVRAIPEGGLTNLRISVGAQFPPYSDSYSAAESPSISFLVSRRYLRAEESQMILEDVALTRLVANSEPALVCEPAPPAALAGLGANEAALFDGGALCHAGVWGINDNAPNAFYTALFLEVAAIADGREVGDGGAPEESNETLHLRIVRRPGQNPDLITPYYPHPTDAGQEVLIIDELPELSLAPAVVTAPDSADNVFAATLTVKASLPLHDGDRISLRFFNLAPDNRLSLISIDTDVAGTCRDLDVYQRPETDCLLLPAAGQEVPITLMMHVESDTRPMPRNLLSVSIVRAAVGDGRPMPLADSGFVVREVPLIGLSAYRPPARVPASAAQVDSADVYVPAGYGGAQGPYTVLSVTLSAPMAAALEVPLNHLGVRYRYLAENGATALPDRAGGRQAALTIPAGALGAGFRVERAEIANPSQGFIDAQEFETPADAWPDANALRLSVYHLNPPEPESWKSSHTRRVGEDELSRAFWGGVTGQPLWFRSPSALPQVEMTIHLWPGHLTDPSHRPVYGLHDNERLHSHYLMSVEIDRDRTRVASGVVPGSVRLSVTTTRPGAATERERRASEIWHYIFTPLPDEREIRLNFAFFPPPFRGLADAEQFLTEELGALEAARAYYRVRRRLFISVQEFPGDGGDRYEIYHPVSNLIIGYGLCSAADFFLPACHDPHPELFGDFDILNYVRPCWNVHVNIPESLVDEFPPIYQDQRTGEPLGNCSPPPTYADFYPVADE